MMLCDVVVAADAVGRKDDEMAFVGFGREEGGVTGLVLDVDIPRPAPTSADAMESTMCSPDDHDGADIAR